MERDPSGTDYGQYWQPEAQPGYGYPPAYPEQPYPDQPPHPEQQQYADPQQYAEQPYQQQYADPRYQQQYAQPGYGEQAPYQADPYQSEPYRGDPAYPSQDYYQSGGPGVPGQQSYPPAVDETAVWAPAESYPADAYQQGPYQADPYRADPYPAAPYQPEGYQPDPYPAQDPSGDSSGDPSAGAARTSAEPVPAAAERPADTDESDASAARGAEPLLPRLAAAAAGRAPGTDRRTFLIRAGIGALALAVVAVAGYVVAGHGSAKKPAAAAGQADLGGSHAKSWAAPAVAAATGNDGLLGSWLLPTALVRGDGTGVTAYDTAKGGKLWTVAPPTPGAVPCAMSATVNSTGIGAVLFQAKPGTGQACTKLVAVDTATGQQKWTATINKATTAYGASVMVNDTRAVAVGDSAAVGYDIATGKQSWTYAGPGKYCGALSGNGTGSTLLLQSTCADTNPKQQAVNLDAGTGKLVWWRGLPPTAASYTVLSAVPAVVAVHMTDPTKDSIMSFSTKGDTQAAIFVSQTAGLLDSTHGSFDPDPALFFQGDTMLAEITPGGAGSGTAGLLSAFNLVDGKQQWQATPQEKGRSTLVGIDTGAAVVATEERIGQQARLSHYDLTTGKEVPGGNFPQGTGSLLTSGRVLYRGSLVAVLPEFTNPYGTSATVFTSAG